MGKRTALTVFTGLRRVVSRPWFRVGVTVLALGIFVHSVDLGAALRAFSHLQWQWALLALFLAGLSVLASILEWGALVRGAGKMLGWRYLGGWYMKGLFINQVLPAGVGSDAVRAVQVGKVAGHGPVIASLVGSRMAGTLGMGLWGLLGAVVLNTVFRVPGLIGFAGLSGVMLLGWVLALGAERLFARVLGKEPAALGWRLHLQRIGPFLRSLARYRGTPGALTCSIAAGGLGWGLNLLSMEAFSQALGYNISWEVFALALPVALLVTFIPISANGIGIREGVLVFLLVQFHVPIGIAAAMSLFVDFQLLPFAAVGAILHGAEVSLRHTQARLSRVGSGGRGFRVAHATLRWVVAPEYVGESTRP
ncbi:MAG TPA: lysylphosphatidylglycerol synthase transmembrane domain-containing protein [Candidatus Dormibacteraeota bacterium]